jgi:hypothetical protein
MLMTINKCSFCGSEKITQKVRIYCDNGENFPLRFYYEKEKKTFLGSQKAEFLYADMCDECGSVIRFYAENLHDKKITGDY